jgi:hypothetical protein
MMKLQVNIADTRHLQERSGNENEKTQKSHQLMSEQHNHLEAELVANSKQVLKGGSKKVKDHGVAIALSSKPSNQGDRHCRLMFCRLWTHTRAEDV